MNVLRPKDLTTQLGISASTLRLWTEKFAPVLSPSATKATTETGTPAQRRFTDDDLITLTRAKQLLGQNKTYEEVLEALERDDELVIPEGIPTPPSAPSTGTTPALSTSFDDHPIVLAFRETLAAKDETIKALQDQITELKQRPASSPPLPPPGRFKWAFLNRLLLENGDG
jgi:DNA-binding transcriptional MerR regulator